MFEYLVLRVKRLVLGSINGIVDVVENVVFEIVMKEVIREIDCVIDEVCDELGIVVVNKYLVNMWLMDVNVKYEVLVEKIQLVVSEGWDDLVEVVIVCQFD